MSIYTDVVAVSRPFLGPATEKFLERQCRFMKVTPPETLLRENLKQLSWLAKNAASVIMDDAKAAQLSAKIEGL